MNFKKILKDKRGEKMFSIWWFIVITMVGVGIVSGVLIFYSAEVDVREEEAKALYSTLNECLIRQGELYEKSLKGEFDVYSSCGLSKEVFEGESNYFFKINFLDEKGNALRNSIKRDSSGFEADCKILEGKEGEKIKAANFPKCFEDKANFIYYIDDVAKKGSLEIITASNQRGRKVA